ncbi:hypothetical protein ASG80_19155 [Agromyces sp. Soil535]|nr:hypothetical protein ASG80_19155 [Agromyces sp. Soil535]
MLWFVGALLVFSLAYGGWVGLRRGRAGRRPPGEVHVGQLLGLAGAVAVATFLLRLVVPFEGDNWFVDVNLWQWPACAALFGLGVVASRKDWLTAVPDRLRRQARAVTLTAVGAAALLALVVAGLGVDPNSSGADGTGPRSRSQPARARSPCSDRCGCSGWRSGVSIDRSAGPAPPSGEAPTARSSCRVPS